MHVDAHAVWREKEKRQAIPLRCVISWLHELVLIEISFNSHF